MSVAIITGSAGLIGSEASRHFAGLGLDVVGIDNDMRSRFFGPEASTRRQRERLRKELRPWYRHVDADIRDADAMDAVFAEYGKHVSLVVHTAARPSHDWAAREPHTDFTVNAVGTLNLLEATRHHPPDAVFIFTSTNKVYGDTPNRLPLIEHETRWEIDPAHTYASGIREDMPIDQTMHSLFGASKVAANILVQEYGRYFGLRSARVPDRRDRPEGRGQAGAARRGRHRQERRHDLVHQDERCGRTGRRPEGRVRRVREVDPLREVTATVPASRPAVRAQRPAPGSASSEGAVAISEGRTRGRFRNPPCTAA